MSKQFNISVEDIKNTLGNTDIIKNDVRIQKVIDLLRTMLNTLNLLKKINNNSLLN